MRPLLLCAAYLALLALALARSSLTSEAAITCIEEMSEDIPTRNLTLALTGRRSGIVSGQTIGPFVVGTNFSLACCARRSEIRAAKLQWWHNNTSMVGQKKHLVDDIAVTTIDVTNVTQDLYGLKFTCRGGRVKERSVILLVIGEVETTDHQGGQTASTMLLMFFGMSFSLPFIVIFLRAKKGEMPT